MRTVIVLLVMALGVGVLVLGQAKSPGRAQEDQNPPEAKGAPLPIVIEGVRLFANKVRFDEGQLEATGGVSLSLDEIGSDTPVRADRIHYVIGSETVRVDRPEWTSGPEAGSPNLKVMLATAKVDTNGQKIEFERLTASTPTAQIDLSASHGAFSRSAGGSVLWLEAISGTATVDQKPVGHPELPAVLFFKAAKATLRLSPEHEVEEIELFGVEGTSEEPRSIRLSATRLRASRWSDLLSGRFEGFDVRLQVDGHSVEAQHLRFTASGPVRQGER